eukprot:577979-Rhodomonas_salina.1
MRTFGRPGKLWIVHAQSRSWTQGSEHACRIGCCEREARQAAVFVADAQALAHACLRDFERTWMRSPPLA